MWYALAVICLILYLLCSAWFFLTVLFQLHLAYKAMRCRRPSVTQRAPVLPFVTIQVPVYNERYVISSLLQSMRSIDYPFHLWELQVLDDSTDDTSEIIAGEIKLLREKGISANIIRRKERTGFKAGALQNALMQSRGELLAIFDADFVPAPDTIREMVKAFADPAVGGLQGRWRHRNIDKSPLTMAQAFLLDSHFDIEQRGRHASGYYISFNGTAGMWRRKCIEDCGGWNGAVLTEDIELSYRAQLKGWKLVYDENIQVAGELPDTIQSFKTQQFRWSKGMAQTALKHLQTIIRHGAPSLKKCHAILHVCGSLAFPAVTGCALMTLPILTARQYLPRYEELTNVILATGITLPLLCLYYYYGTLVSISRRVFWTHLPVFLLLYMGLAVQNSIGVLQAFFGYASPFVRTPKYRHHISGAGSYSESHWTKLNTIELIAGLYLITGVVLSLWWKDYFLLLFILMMLSGIGIMLLPVIRSIVKRRKQSLHSYLVIPDAP